MPFILFGLCAFLLVAPGTSQNEGASHVQQASQTHQDDSKSIPTFIKPKATDQSYEQAKSEASDGVPRRVIFPTPVPVESNKDGWDKALVVLTGLLVFVGLGGIIVAGLTLRGINRQVDTMQRQTVQLRRSTLANIRAARAMHRSNELIIGKERARLSIPITSLKHPRVENGVLSVEYEVLAICPTLAIIVDSEVEAFVPRFSVAMSEFGPLPINLDPVIHETKSIARDTIVCTGHIAAEKIISPTSIGGHTESSIVITGFIKYRDAFQGKDESPHETRFRYKWSGPNTSFCPSFWFVDGGENDNKQS